MRTFLTMHMCYIHHYNFQAQVMGQRFLKMVAWINLWFRTLRKIPFIRAKNNTLNPHTWSPKCIICLFVGILTPLRFLEKDIWMWRLRPRSNDETCSLDLKSSFRGSRVINESSNHHIWSLYGIFVLWVQYGHH